MLFKECRTLLDGEVEHFRDTFSMIFDLQCLLCIACPVADATGHLHIWHKVQVSRHQSLPTTFFAASALHIEAKPRCGISSRLRFRYGGENLPYSIVDSDIGRWRGGGQSANRRLIDIDDVVQVFNALNRLVFTGDDAAIMKLG